MTTVLEILVFFATWCVPCRQELPAIQALSERYASRGVQVVLVSEDEPGSRDDVPRFLARLGVELPVQYDDDSRLLEQHNPAASLPFLVVLNGDGAVVYSHRGYQPGDETELAAALDAALGPLADATSPTDPTTHSQRVTSQLVTTWQRDDFSGDGGRAALGIARLDGELRRGRWRASVRLDGALLAVADQPRDGDLRPERVAVAYQHGDRRVVLGDAAAQLGHGLLLSVRRVDLLGTDTSIQGVHAEGGHGRVSGRLHAGRLNPQNVDLVGYRTFADPSDWVAGLGAEVEIAGTTLSPSLVGYRLGDAEPDGSDAVRVGGGLAVAWLGSHGEGRGELAVLDDADPATPLGHGAFGSLTARRGAWAATLGGKSYRRFAIERREPVLLAFHEPSTLERSDQEVPPAADSIGGRAQLQRTLGAGAAAVSALAYRFSEDGTAPWQGGSVVHGLATVEGRPATGASWAALAGWRREWEGTAIDHRQTQLEVDGAITLGERVGVTAKWDHRFERKALFGGPVSYVRGDLVVAGSLAGRGTVSAIYGYSTETPLRPTHYPAVELRLLLGQVVDLRVLAGRIAGGRLCVSGACRDVPPFEGVRAELLIEL